MVSILGWVTVFGRLYNLGMGAPGIVHHTALYHYYKAKNIDTYSNNIDNVICRSVVDSSAFFRLFYNFENRYVNTLKQQSTIS